MPFSGVTEGLMSNLQVHVNLKMEMTDFTESTWLIGTPCQQHDQPWCAACRPRDRAQAKIVDRTRLSNNSKSPSVTSRGRSKTRKHGSAIGRLKWSEDELIVLVAIFLSNDFSIGDDARPENQAMAEAFSRSPSAVDRQWRNLEDLRSGKEVLHVGGNVRSALEAQLRNSVDGKNRAREIVARRGWQIEWLLH